MVEPNQHERVPRSPSSVQYSCAWSCGGRGGQSGGVWHARVRHINIIKVSRAARARDGTPPRKQEVRPHKTDHPVCVRFVPHDASSFLTNTNSRITASVPSPQANTNTTPPQTRRTTATRATAPHLYALGRPLHIDARRAARQSHLRPLVAASRCLRSVRSMGDSFGGDGDRWEWRLDAVRVPPGESGPVLARAFIASSFIVSSCR